MNDVFGLSGTVLNERYEVQRVIGEGGFGVVYRGEHLALQTPVAIKVLKLPTELSEAAQREVAQRFLEEARLVARLPHPAIVRAIDFGVSTMPAGQVAPWTVLEWIEGQPLSAWLKERQGRPCSPREALGLLRPVFEALAVAHAHGIAHRDIKPPNIMVLALATGASQSAQGYVPATRVLDFGIAKAMQPGETRASDGETQTSSKLNAFSLHYAAPEQLNETRTGPWTDVHALALVLVELLVGRRAYAGSDKLALGVAVGSEARPTPRALGVDVGPWEPVLAKALSLTPSQRQANAGELLAELEARVPEVARRVDGAASQGSSSVENAAAHFTAPVTQASTLRPATAPTVDPPEPSKRTKRARLAVIVALTISGLVAAVAGVLLSNRGPVAVAPPALVVQRVRAPAAVTPTVEVPEHAPTIVPLTQTVTPDAGAPAAVAEAPDAGRRGRHSSANHREGSRAHRSHRSRDPSAVTSGGVPVQ